jgi:hypothetical protein
MGCSTRYLGHMKQGNIKIHSRFTLYFLIYSLFNEAISISDYTASNNWTVMISELELMWKDQP